MRSTIRHRHAHQRSALPGHQDHRADGATPSARLSLRNHRDGDVTLTRAPIGIVPIIFANDDLPELTPPIEPETLVGEIARLGFAGCQLSRALPAGAALKPALQRHGVRIAEVYAALPCTSAGPTADARAQAFERLDDVRRTDGDVLIFSYHLSEERVAWSGRANQPGVPTLSEDGRSRALALVHEVAREARALGRPMVYHP